jgi:hypothetical protein
LSLEETSITGLLPPEPELLDASALSTTWLPLPEPEAELLDVSALLSVAPSLTKWLLQPDIEAAAQASHAALRLAVVDI